MHVIKFFYVNLKRFINKRSTQKIRKLKFKIRIPNKGRKTTFQRPSKSNEHFSLKNRVVPTTVHVQLNYSYLLFSRSRNVRISILVPSKLINFDNKFSKGFKFAIGSLHFWNKTEDINLDHRIIESDEEGLITEITFINCFIPITVRRT